MLEVRSTATERMDDPDLPAETYDAVLADLARINRLTLAARPTLDFLVRGARGMDRFSLLDVGFGQGDMLRAIADWAEAQGKAVDLVGVDLNPRSVAAARAATPAGAPIQYRTGDYADDMGRRWDFVISSLVAHHMTHDELVLFLRFMESEARAGWFVNDLHRHTLSYMGYPLLARLARVHPIVRSDGRTSIARAYRPQEWRALLDEAEVSGAVIARRFPFRLCVERIREA